MLCNYFILYFTPCCLILEGVKDCYIKLKKYTFVETLISDKSANCAANKPVMFEQRVSWRGLSCRAGAVRPSPSPHGGHGGRLVRRRSRDGSSCRCSCVSQLADSPGGGHPASGPAAPLLVVRQKTTRPDSLPGNF